jgi:hypothetical protein
MSGGKAWPKPPCIFREGDENIDRFLAKVSLSYKISLHWRYFAVKNK